MINNNIVIKAGSKISTVSAAKNIFMEYECPEKFDKNMSLYSLQGLLGVVSAFTDPEVELHDKFCTISSGKYKTKWLYSDENLLVWPKKSPVLGDVHARLNITLDILSKVQKMANLISASDLAIISDGKDIKLKVFDKANPSTNDFIIDLDVQSSEEFTIYFKVENMKLFPADYALEVSASASKWSTTVDGNKMTFFIAIEADSVL